MTGPEHYEAAEGFLLHYDIPQVDIARAQVHATLALAAATAMGCHNMSDLDFEAWDKVAGVQP